MSYSYHPPFHYYTGNQYYLRPRQPSPYPEINTDTLKESAKAFKPLMKDADKIIEAFTNSETFAHNIMDAAQRSQTEEIKSYLTEIGINRPVKVNYNPDSLRLELINQSNNMDCCKLSISLKW